MSAPARSSGERQTGPEWHLLVLRSGAPWRDLPTAFGPYTTRYNRFVRWRRAGVWAVSSWRARLACLIGPPGDGEAVPTGSTPTPREDRSVQGLSMT